ncbi:MAG: WD40 repeat domain-containing protein [Planctomycetia bacterium]
MARRSGQSEFAWRPRIAELGFVLCLVAGSVVAAEPVVLRGHEADVFMARFTPDGTGVVTASADGTARLWDAATGAERRRFLGHSGPVACLAVSGDGRTLVTGGQDNAARVWALPLVAPTVTVSAHPSAVNLLLMLAEGRIAVTSGGERGVKLWRLDQPPPAADQPAPPPTARDRAGHESAVVAAAGRSDGNGFVTADESGRMLLWSTLLDEPLGSLGIHRGGITAVAFHPDGQRLLSAGRDGTLRGWSLPPQPPRVASQAGAAVLDIAIVPGGQLAVVAGADAVRVVDTQNFQPLRDLPGPQPATGAVAVTADGSLAAVADAAGGVRLHQVSDAAARGRVAGHDGVIHDVAFLPDGKGLVTAGADGSVRRWLLPGPPAALGGHAAAVRAVAAAPSGGWFASAGDDKTIRSWTAAGQAVRTIGTQPAAVHAVAIAPDEKFVAAGDAAGGLAIWTVADGSPQGAVVAHAGGVRGLAYARNAEAVWSTGADGTLKRWRLPLAAPRPLAGHAQAIRGVAASKDGGICVTGGQDQTVRVWDPRSGQAVRSLGGQPAGPVTAVDVTGDGQFAAAVTESGSLRVWKVADGSAVLERTLPGGGIRDVAFLGAGWVATLGPDEVVRIWDPSTPAAAQPSAEDGMVQAVPVPEGGARVLAASPAGDRLVATAAGTRLVCWTLVEGRTADRPPVTVAVGPAPVTDLEFSADGDRLAAACADGRIAVWDSAMLDAADAQPRETLAHGGAVQGVAFSAAGERLAVAAADGLVTYDLATRKQAEKLVLPGPQTAVAAVAGEFLAGGQDGTGRLWKPALERIIPLGDAAVGAAVVALADDRGVAVLTEGRPGLGRWQDDGTPAPSLMEDLTPTRLAVSPDGRTVAVVDAGGTLGIVQDEQAAAPRRFPLGAGVTAVAFSRDGGQVVVADAAARLRAFDAETGRLVEELAIKSPASVVAVGGPEGRQWMSFGGDAAGAIHQRTWLTAWEEADVAAHAVAVSPDAARIFAAFSSGEIWQIAAATGEVERRLSVSTAVVHDVALDAAAAELAAASDDGVWIWTLADGKVAREFTLAAPARRVAFGAAAKSRLLAADTEGSVHVWDLGSGTILEEFGGQHQGATTVRCAADGLTALSAGAEGRLAAWRPAATVSFPVATAAVSGVVVAAGGGQAFVADDAGGVRLVDLANGSVVRSLENDLPTPVALAMRPDQQRLAIGSGDGKVRLVNPASGETLEVLDAEAAVACIAWRGDGQRLAVGTRASAAAPPRILCFGPSTTTPPPPGREFEAYDSVEATADVLEIAFDRLGRDVWCGGGDGMFTRGALATPAPLFKLDHGGPVLSVVVSRDGGTIVSGGADQSVRVWDAATGQQRSQMAGHTGPVLALAFSPDEAFVVSASGDRSLRLWDVGGGRQLKRVAATEETVYSVAVHPDGRTVAAGGADRAVHLVNLVSGATERSLAGPGEYVHAVAFHRAGTTLLSYGYAGELRIWGLSTGGTLFDTRLGRIGNAAAFDAKGERIVVANGDRTASIVEVPAAAR